MISNYKYDAFISYRRNGGSERAELLKLILEKYGYDSNRIFMDTHSIESCNFKQKIKEAIFLSKDFILIITKGCFDYIKKEDYWIFEIKEALSLGKRIIPIFFDGIESVDPNNLPANLTALSEINGIIYHPQYSEAFYLKLLSFLNPNNINIKKSFPRSRHNLFVAICLFVFICAVCAWYFHYSREKGKVVNQPETYIIDSRSIQKIVDNSKLDMLYPQAYVVDGRWCISDRLSNGDHFEKEFNNLDFMNIAHDIISSGIENGDISTYKKERQFHPDSLQQRNEIWCLFYSGDMETVLHAVFQKYLRVYLQSHYSYNNKNNIK